MPKGVVINQIERQKPVILIIKEGGKDVFKNHKAVPKVKRLESPPIRGDCLAGADPDIVPVLHA